MSDRTSPSPLPGAHGPPPRVSRRRWRPPAHRIRFCTLASCQADSGEELRRSLEARLGVRTDERPTDGSISLEALECIGLCDIQQAVTIDDEPVIGLRRVLRAVDELPEP